jgi:hypothetical protein
LFKLLNLDRVIAEMVEVAKILYMVVVDEEGEKKDKVKLKEKESFRYTRPVLQSTLQLMGCKARHAFKVSLFFFLLLFFQILFHDDLVII